MNNEQLPSPAASDYDTPLMVLAQPLPRPGHIDPTSASNDYPAIIPGPGLINHGLFADEIGAYVWMANRQHQREPVTTFLLAEWFYDQERRRTGEHNTQAAQLAAQIVHNLEAVGAVKAEPDQAERLAAVHEEWDAITTLFTRHGRATPFGPDRDTAIRAARREAESAAEIAAKMEDAPPSTSAADDQGAAEIDAAVERAERKAERRRHRPDEDGHWRGAWPIPADGHYPPKGQNVVYLLRADNELVVYVGSTNHFAARMKAHQGVGKRWSTWTAIPCDSREEAYDVESEYMATHMPHLNVAGPRGGES